MCDKIERANAEDKQKISSLQAEVTRLKSAPPPASALESSSQDLNALKEKVGSLEQENAKLSNDLTSKIGEYEEVKFRLNAMAPSFEKAQARVAQLTAEKNELVARIASLEGQANPAWPGSQNRPAAVSLSASSVMSTGSQPDSLGSGDSAPSSVTTSKRLAFDSPVRFAPTVTTTADTISGMSHSAAPQSSSAAPLPAGSLSAQVPKLFKSSVEPAFPSTQATSTPPPEEPQSKGVTTSESAPSGQVPSSPITYSLATSSAARITPHQSLFGKSAPVAANANVSTSSANSTTAEGKGGSVITEAEQSSQVSGSAEVRGVEANDDDGAGHNDSAGESRDSGSGMPVSSSDGRRKRSATNETSSCESKRHRDSPSEIVTSSEERRDLGRLPT
ncbi:unnamed protein product [Cylicostephanus goldi]|uniref:Uncharacterized protein n=1 Tax=Cylicostephanus goldi TaxID=71465 RepID=A0A3P6QCQ0_CYLGO|nr:unnamed protein product [Cylicostephanus goldi]